MNPGLPEAYREKTKLHIVICKTCKYEFPTRMKIPQCSKCGTYHKEK